MEGERRGELATSVRWLGAPPTLAALVVLLVNDRVLKDQWPGVVTGKLSDVAGLVLAPPLVAVLLAALGVPRSRAWAIGTTGVLFAAAKGLAVGSALASSAWSLVMPSLVRHDPTDLVALPALWLAWRTAGWAARPTPSARRRTTLALGTLVLPCAVFATTATSCSPADGLREVTVYEGAFTGGTGTERRIVTSDWSAVTIDGTGRIQSLANLDRDRLARDSGVTATSTCSTASPQRCWRRSPDLTAAVESSTDGGATWRTEFAVDRRQLKAVREDVGDDTCGSEPPLGVVDLAVLDGPDGQVVAAASSNTGLLLRGAEGDWRRLSLEELHRSAEPPPTPDPEDQLHPVEPTPTTTSPAPATTPTRTRTSDPQPSPTCATPVTSTVTPDPRNGPPTTVTRCR
ncbi:hypothetical protein GCM10022415_00750 [Knoellia locipacati]|uniref:Uncharacterized protein n=1 Tax=Knoellia locipacati TaxID=882824 RepID=A0A512SVR7_9MICO|nr:hypothetical protein [Knoellia locipacati]GEQ12028.1 hypothetical protein KLO01_00750 [Knoellia locipacati]